MRDATPAAAESAPDAAGDAPTSHARPHNEEIAMTLSSFAAASMPGSLESGADYRPGACNIGPAEIARRRRAGHIGVAATLGLLAILVAIGAPPLARLLVALPAAVAASGYLQAQLRFCAGFGSRGEYNFGPLGRTERIDDAEARRRDRSRATQIGLGSLVIGIAVGVAAVLLPL
jgi:hypothetical protein